MCDTDWLTDLHHNSIPKAKQWALSYTPSKGRTLLDVSQGVPGIPPPQALLSALSEAAGSPDSCGYTHVAGEVSLRQALADEMRRVYGDDADVSLQDIALTAGCNMAFMATVMSLADAGDEVIIPVPWCVRLSLMSTKLAHSTFRYFNHQSVAPATHQRSTSNTMLAR